MAKLNRVFVAALIVVATTLSGCVGVESTSSGEGSTGEPPGPLPARTLNWDPPSTFTDGTPLDPALDLDRFEIYMNAEGIFRDEDNPMAVVSAIDPATKQTCRTFDLSNLAPFIGRGVVYHVALRAVAITEVRSGFSPATTFSF